jgi:hypothetical protein
MPLIPENLGKQAGRWFQFLWWSVSTSLERMLRATLASEILTTSLVYIYRLLLLGLLVSTDTYKNYFLFILRSKIRLTVTFKIPLDRAQSRSENWEVMRSTIALQVCKMSKWIHNLLLSLSFLFFLTKEVVMRCIRVLYINHVNLRGEENNHILHVFSCIVVFFLWWIYELINQKTN